MKNNSSKKSRFSISYKKETLDNGLQVILHRDKSNPVVAVAILYHVGSAREEIGKTGFAHFFEHMMFQRSENIKRNEFFSKISDLGGMFNGGTWQDGTIYYQSVPNDALEKVLWMESDRMGFFINTVTQKGLERELDVVINEKRQIYDNAPYGHTNYVIMNNLYPKEHPYSHTVIGETADLKQSNLDDVKEFYKKYYKPNNATLVISGDIDIEKTLILVEKYFGEIKSGATVEKMQIKPFSIKQNKKLFFEDKLIKLPELNIAYKGIEMFHKDAYTLSILGDLLCNNKTSPVYRNIVEKYKYAPSVSMSNNTREHGGEIIIRVRTFNNINLEDVYSAIKEGFKEFEKNDINEAEIESCKTIAETDYYSSFTSNLHKALTLAESNVFGGDPDIITKELETIQNITKEDVIDVYNRYIKEANFIASSFVPEGAKDRALNNSIEAEVILEPIEAQNNQSEAGEIIDDELYQFTPTKFDRTKEPKLARLHKLKLPEIWHSTMHNGITIKGITDRRLPLVHFAFTIKAGSLQDKESKAGTAYFLSKLLRESSAKRKSEDLEKDIKSLGASLYINTYKEWTIINGSCLSKKFKELFGIVEDIITNPAWDEISFKKVQSEVKTIITQASASPQKIAEQAFKQSIFGEDNPLAENIYGNLETLDKITINDLKEYYEAFYTPTICDFSIVGNITKQAVEKVLVALNYSWKPRALDISDLGYSVITDDNNFKHIEYKNLPQSLIFIGNSSISRNDPDYIKARVINYKLGESSASILFRILRLEHGYTYGAYSVFNSHKSFGAFIAFSSVQASATKHALKLFKEIFKNYRKNYTEDDLHKSKFAILRKYSTKYETYEALLSMLIDMSTFNFNDDFVINEMEAIANLNYKEALATIKKYIDYDKMKIIVLGDKKAL